MDQIFGRDKGRGHQRVAHLVIGNTASFPRAEYAAPFFKSGDDAFNRHGEVVDYRLAIAPCRHDRRLIDQV
jgi:hypothetical protein